MRLPLIIMAAVAFACTGQTQDLGVFEEVTAGNFFGIGARQMSMGGAGIAASLDGAALYYNPAALAGIHRIEFQLGLTHQKFSNTTTQPPNRYVGFTSVQNGSDIDMTKTRLGTVNLSVPVPTYRGSLVLGFGINRIHSFDRAAVLDVIDRNAVGLELNDYAKEFEIGGIYMYSAGAGVDISPNLSLGLALNVYSGEDEFTYDYRYVDETNNYEEAENRQITEDYIGVSLKGGLLARPNANLSIGLTIESPLDYQVEWVYLQEVYNPDSTPDTYLSQSVVEYDLTRPFIFGAGLVYRFHTFTLTGDAEYIDWPQMSYNDNPFMELDNDSLAYLYRDVINLRGGIEYQIPAAGLALRGGVFSNPLPYRKEFIDDDRQGFSFGFGWLIDRVLLLESAFVHGSYKRRYSPANADYVNEGTGTAFAEDSFSRVYFTLSYRY